MTTPKKKPTPAGKPQISPMSDAFKQPPPWSKEAKQAQKGQRKGQVGTSPAIFQRKGLSGSGG